MAKGDFVFEVNEAEYARLTSAMEQLSEIEQSTAHPFEWSLLFSINYSYVAV